MLSGESCRIARYRGEFGVGLEMHGMEIIAEWYETIRRKLCPSDVTVLLLLLKMDVLHEE